MLRKILVLAIMAALILPAIAYAQTPMPMRISGVINNINADLHTVTIKTPTNMTTFKVVATTKITKEGVPATFADLKVGQAIVAGVVPTTEGLVAQFVNIGPQQEVKGTAGIISAINLEARTVAIKTQNGTELRFLVNEKTQIIRDGQPATLDKLQIGDNARIGFIEASAGLVAVKIDAVSRPPIKTAEGKISAINAEAKTFTITNMTGALTFLVDEQTKVFKDTFPSGFNQLAVGDFAKVAFFRRYTGELVAVRIDARSADAVIVRIRGQVAEIDIEKHLIVVQTLENTRIPVLVGPGTEIFKFIGPVPFEALLVGDKVDVAAEKIASIQAPIALKINVMPNRFAGKVSGINPEEHTITVDRGTTSEALSMTFKVVEKTLIVKNGVRVPFSALALNDFVAVDFFNFPDGAIASRITVQMPVQ